MMQEKTDKCYIIVSDKWSRETPTFYRENACGYTDCIEGADTYTEQEAKRHSHKESRRRITHSVKIGSADYKRLKAKSLVSREAYSKLEEENQTLKEINKELARLIGCLEPNEEGKSVCDPPCICCKALGRK